MSKAISGKNTVKTSIKSRILRKTALGGLGLATVIGSLLAGTNGLQNAIANGDTRTLSFFHAHTREKLTVTFRRNGRYDQAELQKINWIMRDWRNNETVAMDPKLFDIVWAAQREAGSTGTIKILSAYRSPKTNAMLRRRSSAVAKNSQHMVGKALDFQLPDADMSLVRNIGMRLQRGGVGYYANVPFVHLDSGSVRSWPRMPRAQLARLFPDGRTVHIPADGKPLEGFEAAKQMLAARGDSIPGAGVATVAQSNRQFANRQSANRKSLWAALFGGADEEEDAEIASTSRRQIVASHSQAQTNAGSIANDDGDQRRFFSRNNTTPARQAQPAVQPVPETVIASAPVRAPVVSEAPLVLAAAAVPLPEPKPVGPSIAGQSALPAFANFSQPVPVARPASLLPASLVASRLAASKMDRIVDNAVVAMLPQPPRRPGQAGIVDAPVMAIAAAPLPPLRPAGLAPVVDRNALAAIAAASRQWDNESANDRTLRSRALAYTAEPEIFTPPVPPMRPVSAQLTRTLPAMATASSRPSERHTLDQLFATVETGNKPALHAKVTTARVVAAKPGAQTAASASAAVPKMVVQMGFNDAGINDLKTDAFTGPAVKPLPIARFSK